MKTIETAANTNCFSNKMTPVFGNLEHWISHNGARISYIVSLCCRGILWSRYSAKAASMYSCHLVIPKVIFRCSSSFGDFTGRSFSFTDYLGKHRALIKSDLVISWTNNLQPKSYLTLTLNLPLPNPYPT